MSTRPQRRSAGALQRGISTLAGHRRPPRTATSRRCIDRPPGGRRRASADRPPQCGKIA